MIESIREFDSFRFGCEWHAIDLPRPELAAGECLTVCTRTRDTTADVAPAGEWLTAEVIAGPLSDNPKERIEIVVPNEPGRYLDVRLIGTSGDLGARLEKARPRFPRNPLIDRLPPVFREDPRARKDPRIPDDRRVATFLRRFLAVSQYEWDELEAVLGEFRRYLDPATVPDSRAASWLARWFGIRMEPEWLRSVRSDARTRTYLGAALPLASRRGTASTAEPLLKAWLAADEKLVPGHRLPRVVEGFRYRRLFAFRRLGQGVLGRTAAVAIDPMGEAARLDSGARLGTARLLPETKEAGGELLDYWGNSILIFATKPALEALVTKDGSERAAVVPSHLRVAGVAVSPPTARLSLSALLGLNTVLGIRK